MQMGTRLEQVIKILNGNAVGLQVNTREKIAYIM